MPIYLFTMMCYFDNWSLGMWCYLMLHGSYGIFWFAKDIITPDFSFARPISYLGVISSVSTVLGPYSIAGFMVASGRSQAAQNPSPERVGIAGLMYIFGIVMMLCTDVHKYYILQENKRKKVKALISDGFASRSRNLNYLGEILLYASFNVIAQV